MSYRDEIIKAMELLAQDERIIVLGQGVAYPCAVGLIETLYSSGLALGYLSRGFYLWLSTPGWTF